MVQIQDNNKSKHAIVSSVRQKALTVEALGEPYKHPSLPRTLCIDVEVNNILVICFAERYDDQGGSISLVSGDMSLFKGLGYYLAKWKYDGLYKNRFLSEIAESLSYQCTVSADQIYREITKILTKKLANYSI